MNTKFSLILITALLFSPACGAVVEDPAPAQDASMEKPSENGNDVPYVFNKNAPKGLLQ